LNPDYSKADTKKISSDFRSTLYWSPTLFLDTNNKSIPVKFYNNDYNKKVKIIVKGWMQMANSFILKKL
jgi:hypothetical protein